MKVILVLLIVLLASGAAFVRYFPEQAGPLIEDTPLERLAAVSKPVYQWRDVNGVLQVTDEPPPDGVPYEVKQYALDANLIPSFKQSTD